MKRIFAAVVLCLLLYACKPGIPKDIIQPDQMGKVLFDIHVVDGYITTIANKDSAKWVASSYYKGIYKKFGIDSARYAKSMDYYYEHPDVMEKIYQQVEQTFTKERAKNDKLTAEEEVKAQAMSTAAQDPSLATRYLQVNPPALPVHTGFLDGNPFRFRNGY